MRIFADVNVPEEYVAALRGDGHEVTYTRSFEALGPEATDDEITEYAIEEGFAILYRREGFRTPGRTGRDFRCSPGHDWRCCPGRRGTRRVPPV
jgi:hypothetical protein